ncbi:hypothetical protein BD324DRAFT_229847 [Kockovaella imperatae]|uniref:Fungal-specific transcription factor domain-domain-containing protein n=1 Tax=Kockovaella imperatae TaxID=4999 RepID=A0A1Y1UQ82_9TREE|nr:hypothetical protein BD324DRAFT_229847 [Kockovaella imperatae]ORX39727.1 hypothetical protein BD324DRAFT_229847 [Kockovaella imperatae]
MNKPKGHDIVHDALRYACLSLADADLAIKLKGRLKQHHATIYASSGDYWHQAVSQIQLAAELGMHLNDQDTGDVILAAVVILATRDRLAGWSEWEMPLSVGYRVLRELGGPDLYIASNPTRLRRFLVEQLVSIELLACLTAFKQPMIGDWYNHWLTEGGGDLEAVYGWDREAFLYGLRAITLCGDCVRLYILRTRCSDNPSKQVKELIETQIDNCKARISKFLDTSEAVRAMLQAIPNSAVRSRSICLQACVEICLLWILAEGNDTIEAKSMADRLSQRVEAIVQVADEAMARGDYAGMLLPLTWADGSVTPRQRELIMRLLNTLEANYHLDHESLWRITHIDWSAVEGFAPARWEEELRQMKIYFPIY